MASESPLFRMCSGGWKTKKRKSIRALANNSLQEKSPLIKLLCSCFRSRAEKPAAAKEKKVTKTNRGLLLSRRKLQMTSPHAKRERSPTTLRLISSNFHTRMMDLIWSRYGGTWGLNSTARWMASTAVISDPLKPLRPAMSAENLSATARDFNKAAV